MAEILLFNHIPKTAGKTLRYVLLRAIGKNHEGLLTSAAMVEHSKRVPEIAARLERLEGDCAIHSQVGVGLEDHLPAGHTYRRFTVLRDPVERTISHFFYVRQFPDRPGGAPVDMSFLEFLEERRLNTFNPQVAFLGGLSAKHFLEGVPLSRDRYDRDLLAQAKRNLELHDVVGLKERFDETLLLLRRAFGWSTRATLYRRMNVGPTRFKLSKCEREAVEASSQFDVELYAFAAELFAARLEEVDGRTRQLRRFRVLNSIAQSSYSIYAPGRELVRRLDGVTSPRGS